MTPASLRTALFGLSDGLIASVAIVLATQSAGRHVVLIALGALLAAEGLGMAASEYLSDPALSLRQAVVMGAATTFSIAAVGAPWLFSAHALLASVVVAVAIGAVIAQERPGSWTTWLQTFGVLVGVATIAATVGAIK